MNVTCDPKKDALNISLREATKREINDYANA